MSTEQATLALMRQAPIHIKSIDDPRVDVYRNLRDHDLRGREGLFMAESPRVLRRLLHTRHAIHSMLLTPSQFEHLREAITAGGREMPVFLADVEVLSQIVGFHLHRGALAAAHRPTPDELSLDAALGHLRDRERCTLVLAEAMNNVDNMGALFRNAAAFGVDGVMLDSRCCDPLYRKSIRVSVGHALSMPFAVCDDWPHTLGRLREEWGITLMAVENAANAAPLWRMPKHNKLAIVFGSESGGLRQQTLDLCDEVCRIPMAESVPSLNVAVASAVVLYELRRECGDFGS